MFSVEMQSAPLPRVPDVTAEPPVSLERPTQPAEPVYLPDASPTFLMTLLRALGAWSV
jgi:hypothetical protein